MRAILTALTLLTASILAGCLDDAASEGVADDALDDAAKRAQTAYRALPETITGLTQLAHAEDVESGSGIWLYGHHAYVGGLGSGIYVVNISDPEKPVVAGHLNKIKGDDGKDIEIHARDADMLDQGDRLILVVGYNSEGMHFIDVTDPADPTYLTSLTDFRAHNVAVPPGQSTIVYNSMSSSQGSIHVIDASDPESPKIVKEVGEHGCHDITFLDLPDKKRAYCAGVAATDIFDISDVLNPKLISSIDDTRAPTVGHGGLHHLAMPNQDGTVLIIGDEWQGGGSPGGCFAYVDTPAGQVSTPIGALTFFDISDETDPQMLSWISPPTPTPRVPEVGGSATSALPSCTAHFGTLIEDRPLLVMAWYTAGVLLIDFSDPSDPRIVDQIVPSGANVWDARFYQGYVFTGDTSRGLDVLSFV